MKIYSYAIFRQSYFLMSWNVLCVHQNSQSFSPAAGQKSSPNHFCGGFMCGMRFLHSTLFDRAHFISFGQHVHTHSREQARMLLAGEIYIKRAARGALIIITAKVSETGGSNNKKTGPSAFARSPIGQSKPGMGIHSGFIKNACVDGVLFSPE